MKKHILSITALIFFTVFFCATELSAQKYFKGRIVYQMSYPASMVDQLTLSNLPTLTTVSVRGHLSKHEITSEAFTQIKINNLQSRSSVTLMEFGKEKYSVSKTAEQIATSIAEMGQPEIKFTNETKEILGYTCKKAVAISTNIFGEEIIKEIYYTEEFQGLPLNFDTPYEKIPGIMLEYEIQIKNLNVKYEAKSIRKRNISARQFKTPKEYTPIGFDELKEKLL